MCAMACKKVGGFICTGMPRVEGVWRGNLAQGSHMVTEIRFDGDLWEEERKQKNRHHQKSILHFLHYRRLEYKKRPFRTRKL